MDRKALMGALIEAMSQDDDDEEKEQYGPAQPMCPEMVEETLRMASAARLCLDEVTALQERVARLVTALNERKARYYERLHELHPDSAVEQGRNVRVDHEAMTYQVELPAKLPDGVTYHPVSPSVQ